MIKPGLLLLAEAPPRCLCYRKVFRQKFDCRLAETTEEFIRQIHAGADDPAVICLCARHEVKRDDLLPFENLPNILPTLVCAKTLSPEVMRHALERGVEHFISWRWRKMRLNKRFGNPLRMAV